MGSNAAGNVVIVYTVWSTDQYSPGEYELSYRTGSVGNGVGGRTILATFPTSREDLYDVSVFPNGEFVIAWSDAASGMYHVRAQRFDAMGNPGNSVVVYETSVAAAYHPRVACGPSRDYMVAWLRDDINLTPRTGQISAGHVTSSDVVIAPLSISDPGQIYPFNVDVEASPTGSYTVVFDNSELVAYNTWRRKVWARTITPTWVVPVAFADIHAAWEPPGVRLTWELQSDDPLAGLRVYRGGDGEMSTVLNDGFLPTSVSEFLDSDVRPGRSYDYRVAAVTPDGGEVVSLTARATVPAPELSMATNVPNPFNPTTTIPYSIAEAGHVRIEIYDASGALIRTLYNGSLAAGPHEARWNGTDDTGRHVASGVYFCVLETHGRVVTQKMTLLK